MKRVVMLRNYNGYAVEGRELRSRATNGVDGRATDGGVGVVGVIVVSL